MVQFRYFWNFMMILELLLYLWDLGNFVGRKATENSNVLRDFLFNPKITPPFMSTQIEAEIKLNLNIYSKLKLLNNVM